MATPLYPGAETDFSVDPDIFNDPSEMLEQTIGVGVPELHPLNEDEVGAVLSHEIQDALGGLGSQVAEQRRKALRYYYGRPFGNEQEGRSQVVLTQVADTVEWIMPHLLRMFVGPGPMFKFSPTSEADEPFAEQASDVINYIFWEKCDGFKVLLDWFKTALIEKTGIVKPAYEERFEPKRETYRGLTIGRLGQLLEEGRTELVALEELEPDPNVIDAQTGGPARMFDVTVVQTKVVGEFRVFGIPPEEFLIARRSVDLNDRTPFSGHRQKVTVSDLIALGNDPELVVNLPSDDTPEFSQGRTERLNEDETFPITMGERADAASRELWVIDIYARLDEDGDGYSELRNYLVVGDTAVTILHSRDATMNPFCTLHPIPMPHKFHGISIADLVMDLQLIDSQILRQMLDNLYLQNNNRFEVVEGMVELDDLLTSRPGGIVRVQAPNSVTPLITPPLGRAGMDLLEYLEGVQEKRTGVSAWQQGPDAGDLKNQTADATTKVMKAAYSKIELIARIFAETGVKDLGKKLLRLFIENNTAPLTMKLRGEWVEVDPSTWTADMECTVTPGLGVGAAAEQIGFLESVLDKQQRLIDAGMTNMVTPRHIYNSLMALTDAMGFRRDDRFFGDPGGAEFPEKDPPLEDQVRMKEHERRAQDDKAQTELSTVTLSVEAAKNEDLQRFRFAELAQENELKRLQMESQERIEEKRIDAQIHAAMARTATTGEA